MRVDLLKQTAHPRDLLVATAEAQFLLMLYAGAKVQDSVQCKKERHRRLAGQSEKLRDVVFQSGRVAGFLLQEMMQFRDEG